MRRLAIAVLIAAEVIVGCGILVCSVQFSDTLVRDCTVARVAHAVVRSTQRMAEVEVRITLRHRA